MVATQVLFAATSDSAAKLQHVAVGGVK